MPSPPVPKDLRAYFEASVRKTLAASKAEGDRHARRQDELLTQLLASLLDESGELGSRICSRAASDEDRRQVSLVDLLPDSGAEAEHQIKGAAAALEAKVGSVKTQKSQISVAASDVLSSAWKASAGITASAGAELARAKTVDVGGLKSTNSGASVVKRQSSMKRVPPPLEQFVLSSAFSGLCTLVIMLNSVYMGMIADLQVKYAFDNFGSDEPDTHLNFTTYFEIGFLAFYGLELFLKFLAFKLAFFNGKDSGWNIFDLMLVIAGLVGIFEAGFNVAWLRILRTLVKLIKALRVFQLVQFFGELRVIMLSILHSLHTFFWAMMTTMLMMYMCAIVFVQGIADYIGNTPSHEVSEIVLKDVSDNWGSLHSAMLTEYKAVAGGGPWGTVTEALWDVGVFYYVFFLFYIAVIVLAVFRLLTGIFVQKAKAAADHDRDQTIAQHMVQVFKDLDQDNSGTISRNEFKECIESSAAMEYFSMLHIKPADARNLFSLMDASGDDSVDTQEFISGCQKFGGWARSIDLAMALRGIHEISMTLNEFMCYVEECFDSHFGRRDPPT